MINREELFRKIESSIYKNGFHVTIVTGGDLPRFAYTIGLKNRLNHELVFAGGEFFSEKDLNVIFKQVALNAQYDSVQIAALGNFTKLKVHASWSKLMMLGVFDFFNLEHVDAMQIMPEKKHFTLDIPDLSEPFNVSDQPVWRWLDSEWTYSVPKDSTVVTNLAALKGNKITEVMRWEESEWEMFAGNGPDVPKQEMRVVSLGTLLGLDPTLVATVELDIGKGLWRDPTYLVWNAWG